MASKKHTGNKVSVVGALALLAGVLVFLPACEPTGSAGDDGEWELDEEPDAGEPFGSVEEYGLSCSARTLTGPTGPLASITLVNDSSKEIRFLKWHTPWDDRSRVFDVTSGKESLEYLGWEARRSVPSDGDFESIPPHSSITTEYPVAEHYAATRSDTYDISMHYPTLTLGLEDRIVTVLHHCGTGEVELQEHTGIAETSSPLTVHDDCTTSQKSAINGGIRLAETALRMAKELTYSDNGVFVRWFGGYSSAKAAIVRNHLNLALGAKWDYEVRCGGHEMCTPSIDLHCYPNQVECNENCLNDSRCDYCYEYTQTWNGQEYKNGEWCYATVGSPDAIALIEHRVGTDRFYLCSPYYQLPSVSVEAWSSKAGVIAHELTHINDGMSNTMDVKDISQCTFTSNNECYGAENATKLALDPSCDNLSTSCKALQNAENYEHFVGHALVLGAARPALSLFL